MKKLLALALAAAMSLSLVACGGGDKSTPAGSTPAGSTPAGSTPAGSTPASGESIKITLITDRKSTRLNSSHS